jgi:hypothetical protein
MVIGLLILTAIPTVTGVAQGISQQRAQTQRKVDQRRLKRFNISIHCDASSSKAKEIHGGQLVLRDERTWIAQPGQGDGYVASAFYIDYPDNERVPIPLGLVSQVSDNPPLLNWLYLDKETMELKYGNRTTSIEHHVGPWDWTEDEVGIVFEGEERFTAVETERGQWQVYFDCDDDMLKAYVPKERRKLQISLERSMVEEEESEEKSEEKS